MSDNNFQPRVDFIPGFKYRSLGAVFGLPTGTVFTCLGDVGESGVKFTYGRIGSFVIGRHVAMHNLRFADCKQEADYAVGRAMTAMQSNANVPMNYATFMCHAVRDVFAPDSVEVAVTETLRAAVRAQQDDVTFGSLFEDEGDRPF